MKYIHSIIRSLDDDTNCAEITVNVWVLSFTQVVTLLVQPIIDIVTAFAQNVLLYHERLRHQSLIAKRVLHLPAGQSQRHSPVSEAGNTGIHITRSVAVKQLQPQPSGLHCLGHRPPACQLLALSRHPS